MNLKDMVGILYITQIGDVDMRNLYFLDSRGGTRLLATNVDWETALKVKNDFLDAHNFKSYYMRTWEVSEGTMMDVGSHTEFFLWGVI